MLHKSPAASTSPATAEYTYRGLTRIEDAFRVTNSDLKARPIFVQTPKHINAHFLICLIALTMIRLVQYKILTYQGKQNIGAFGWEDGLSAARIQKALQGFTVDALPQGYYRVSKRTEDLDLVLKALEIDHGLRLPTLSEIKQYRFQIRKKLGTNSCCALLMVMVHLEAAEYLAK